MPQVLGEDPDGFVVGLFLGRRQLFGFDRGAHEAFERIRGCGLHPRARRRAGADELAAKPLDAAVGVDVDRDLQHAFVGSAAHGQKPVRRDAAQRRRGVEIVGIFGSFGLLALHDLRVHDALAGEGAAQAVAGLFVLRDAFGDDVARPGEGVFGGRYFGRDVTPGLLCRVAGPLCHDEVGERFQPPFAGHGGAGAAFGLVGQVEVLQLHRVPALLDAPAELRSQFPLLFDGREYGLAAGFEFGEAFQLLLDGAHLHFVERAGRLLAVAADEGDRRTVAQQAHGALHLRQGDSESSGDDLFDHVRKSLDAKIVQAESKRKLACILPRRRLSKAQPK